MKQILILSILLIKIHFLTAQNLVSNPSFEEMYQLPECHWLLTNEQFNGVMKDWINPSAATPDIHTLKIDSTCCNYPIQNNCCIGSQAHRTGKTMVGITNTKNNYREYIHSKLKSPLIAGRKYNITFYASLAENSAWGSNNIGMFLSNFPVDIQSTYVNFPYSPQLEYKKVMSDTKNWIKIDTTIIATETWNYITIGNFKDSKSTQYDTNYADCNAENVNKEQCYYYIDDISIFDACLQTMADTSICIGDEMVLKATAEKFNGWANKNNPTIILSTNTNYIISPKIATTYIAYTDCDTNEVTISIFDVPKFKIGNDTTLCYGYAKKVSPKPTVPNYTYLWQNDSKLPDAFFTEPGSFWLQAKDQNNCIAYDTININFYDCTGLLEMPNIFTPNSDGLNETFLPLKMTNIVKAELSIFNRWGEQIFKTDDMSKGWTGNGSSDGVYYWMVEFHDLYNNLYKEKGYLVLAR